MKKSILLVLFVLTSFCLFAQGTLRAMVYNLLEFPSASPSNRGILLRNILSDTPPDIFMACEIESLAGANIIRDVTFNGDTNEFERAPFATNQSSDSPLQQMLYYRRNMFSLENFSTLVTNTRDITRYVLKVNTANGSADPLRIYIYIAHLKSSEGTANELERLDMVQKFTTDLETLPSTAFVLFAGDLNVYSALEPAYQELLDPTNAIRMRDPLNAPGDWHHNEGFAALHTQSTRISSGSFGAGAGGGMDDRFDFILISENMLSNPKLRYIENSYHTLGNNGNCYDKDVNDPGCIGEFDQELRNNIYSMSDHLPVVLELQTNQEIVLGTPAFEKTEPRLKLKSTVVTQEIVLLSTQIPNSDFSFSIYNALGQKVLDWHETPSHEISVAIAMLASGVYYIKTNLPNTKPLKFLKTS